MNLMDLHWTYNCGSFISWTWRSLVRLENVISLNDDKKVRQLMFIAFYFDLNGPDLLLVNY